MELKLHFAHNIKTVDPTLLNYIETKKNEEVFAMLQNINPDDLKGEIGMDLLHFTVHSHNHVMTQHLIESGVNVDVLDKFKNTPLMTAVRLNGDEKTIKVLLDSNANIYYVKTRHTLFVEVVSTRFHTWPIKKLFIDRFKSDCSNNEDIVTEKLLSMNVRFCHAVHLKDLQILKNMLSRGCLISDYATHTNRTAIHEAVVVKDLEIIKFLLQNGANVNAVDFRGKIPFSLAYDYDESDEENEILNYLLDRGSSLDLLIAQDYDQKAYLLCFGKKAIVQTLLSRQNIDFNTRGHRGRTNLHYIAVNKRISEDQGIVELLQQFKIDVNISSDENESPLHVAVKVKNTKLAKFLLERGANVNQRNIETFTALYLAIQCYSGYSMSAPEVTAIYNLIQLLLQYGADPQLLTDNNFTVLDYIVFSQCYDFAKPILAYLVLHKERGGVINDEIRHLINSNSTLKSEFEWCKNEFEEIRDTRFNDTVTAGNLMLESKKKIKLRARNKEVFDQLTQFYSTATNSPDSYFYDLLKRRLTNILPHIEVRFKAIERLCCILKFDYYAMPNVIDNIIDYFENEDLQNIIQV